MRHEYLFNSPIFYLDRVQTPLLILHGKDKHTVSSSPADVVFAGLKSLSKEVEYRRYSGQDHVLHKEENVVDAMNATLRWFDKYLKAPDGTGD